MPLTSSEVKVVVEQLQNAVDYTKHRLFEELQDKLIKWSRTQFFFLGLAISIFLFSFGLYGFNEFKDFKNKIDTYKMQIYEESEKVISGIKYNKKNIEEQVKELEKSLIKIDPSTLDKVTLRINGLEKALAEKLESVEAIGKQVIEDRKEIRKIQNSLVDIFIHFYNLDEENESIIKDVFNELRGGGFLIDWNNIAYIEADKSEIIYYEDSVKKQAEQIQQILSQYFPLITSRLLRRSERDPREILVKLRVGQVHSSR